MLYLRQLEHATPSAGKYEPPGCRRQQSPTVTEATSMFPPQFEPSKQNTLLVFWAPNNGAERKVAYTCTTKPLSVLTAEVDITKVSSYCQQHV